MSHENSQDLMKSRDFSDQDSGEETSDLHLLFALGDEIYATHLMQIRELIEPEPVRRVPETVACFEGLMNVRGEIVAVIDLRLRFGMPAPAHGHSILLVFDTEHGPIAARVDKALRVAQISDKKIVKQPNIATPIPREYLIGAADIDGRIVAFMDLRLVLSQSELAAISGQRASAA